jgi:hypothetical protein
MFSDEDFPRVRATDPDTSSEGADESQTEVAYLRSLVLKVLQAHPEGMTDHELTVYCIRNFDVPVLFDTWRKRRSDLTHPSMGLVYATTERRHRPGTSKGATSTVYKAVTS